MNIREALKNLTKMKTGEAQKPLSVADHLFVSAAVWGNIVIPESLAQQHRELSTARSESTLSEPESEK